MTSQGIFPPSTARHGPASNLRREAYRRRLHLARNRRMDQLAEMVSLGWSIKAAGAALGVSQQTASAMWRDIKARLGGQAV